MIAVDTNILVYAHREDSPWHGMALEAVRKLAEGYERWAIPWPCIHEFFAIATHPRIYAPPTPPLIAFKAVQAWMESSQLCLLAEGPGYIESLHEMVRNGKVQGPRIHDARIAALCLQHGVRELWSSDRDFSRFPSLRLHNPLIQ